MKAAFLRPWRPPNLLIDWFAHPGDHLGARRLCQHPPRLVAGAFCPPPSLFLPGLGR